MKRGLFWGTVGLAVLPACGGDARKVTQVPQTDECTDHADGILCSEAVALTCVGGHVSKRDDCGNQTCFSGFGCHVCAPNQSSCDGNARYVCNAQGTASTMVEQCAAPLYCSPIGCADLCANAASARSYLGCDYWPVFTSNSQLDSLFFPAVAVGNSNLVPAHIVISKGAATITEVDVPAGSAQTVNLSFDEALKSPNGSALVRDGAYHLTSSVPVTVHQYNPLLFEVDRDCANRDNEPPSMRDSGTCNSYTNDASLLFPSTALKQDPKLTDNATIQFIAASRPSYMQLNPQGDGYAGLPGSIAVVAVGDQPAHVTVQVTAYTMASPASVSVDAVEALQPGDTIMRTLNPGDVLELETVVPTDCASPSITPAGTFCDPGPQYDLTGSVITADAPVEVISGHDCANVPFDRVACDHLEESLVPLHAWGASAVVTAPSASAGGDYMLKLVSAEDGNMITFDPPLHDPVTLGKNQSLEFIGAQTVLVRGTGRLMVAQYLLGQGNSNEGDPAFSLAVPIGQYRTSYNFISPATYVRDFVDVIASESDTVTLDGKLINTFTQIGSSAYVSATVELTEAGAHEIHGSSGDGIGIVLYGVAPYTAYLLPGGLDLIPLQDIPI